MSINKVKAVGYPLAAVFDVNGKLLYFNTILVLIIYVLIIMKLLFSLDLLDTNVMLCYVVNACTIIVNL